MKNPLPDIIEQVVKHNIAEVKKEDQLWHYATELWNKMTLCPKTVTRPKKMDSPRERPGLRC